MLEQTLLDTYTRKAGQGIYKIALDITQGHLTEATFLLEETNPTYLALSQRGELFSVTSVDGEGGTVIHQSKMNHFNLLNRVVEEDAPLCYAAVGENRQLVYAANYHRGIAHMYYILGDNSLEDADKVIYIEPTGPYENQNDARVHYTGLTPDQHLVACGLRTDRVYAYNVNLDGKLSRIVQFVIESGAGPCHSMFHPTKSLAYLSGELDSTVSVLSYDGTDSFLAELQKVPTLPADYGVPNGGAVIRVPSSGRFLYASDRDHNSIAVYAVPENSGAIERIQLISTEGDVPRDLDLDPSEDFIVIANQDSDSLTLHRRSQEAGLLEMIQKDVAVPERICVLFVQLS